MSQTSSVTVDALRSMPIFESLSIERLVPIARVAVFRKMPRNATILRAGDRTDFVYFILSGVLKVLVSDEEGREVILSNLGAGEFFGEMELLRSGKAIANVRAGSKPVEVIALPRTDFVRVMNESPITAEAVAKIVQKRLEAHRIPDHRAADR